MSDNNSLRKCSRCHSTKLESYFGFNKKGELYKLCDNCRIKRDTYNEKYQAEIRAKPLDEQYYICDKCNSKVHRLNEGMARHHKRWTCVKKQMEGKPGKKEFFEWVVANKNNLLRDYHKYIEEAETYLNELQSNKK